MDICRVYSLYMDYKVPIRKIPVCLECGDKIRYGRADKKFCCESCRSKYNNEQVRSGRIYRRRVMGALARNYEILDNLVKSNVDSADLYDLEGLGFSPGVVTSHRKVNRHDEYSCFDIKYIMTPSRLSSIKKISLNLQVGKKNRKL